MNEALKEWLECCAGRLEAESCNLLGLFKSGLTKSELASVFGPFPHSQEMLRGVNRLLDAGNLSGYIYLQQPKLGDSALVIAAAKQWLTAQVRYCALTGELEVANRVDGIDVEIVGAERFEEAQATPSVNDDLHQHVRQSIFRYFDHAEEMESRTRKILGAGYLGEYVYLQQPKIQDRQQLLVAATAWIREQGQFCRHTGEEGLAAIADSVEVKLIDRRTFEELKARQQPEDDVSDHITHAVLHSLRDQPDAAFALVEALYGLAASYDLAWYVVQPLLKMDIDFAIYFDFWRLGGAGVLTEDAYWVRGEN